MNEEKIIGHGVTRCFPSPMVTLTLKDSPCYIDISKLLSILETDGVTVTGTEPMNQFDRPYAITGFSSPQCYSYEVCYAGARITIQYNREGSSRNITMINIESNGKIETLHKGDVGPMQSSDLLVKCGLLVAAANAVNQANRQKKFDELFDSIANR